MSNQKEIYEILKKMNVWLSSKDLVKYVDCNMGNVAKHLNNLHKRNLVEFKYELKERKVMYKMFGEGRNCKYRVKVWRWLNEII